jgi:hypothetical protein
VLAVAMLADLGLAERAGMTVAMVVSNSSA